MKHRATIFARQIYNVIAGSNFGWSGDYDSWEKAQAASGAYSQRQILEKVLNATLQVKEGKAEYERDSVIFDRIEYSWPLLSFLMWMAAKNKGNLHVIDFGGSLGSSFFQNRKFLKGLTRVQWNVVEQASFVECGRENIQDEVLQFFNSIEECIATKEIPDVLIASCVLPYLQDPNEVINGFLGHQIPYILIDNTPFNLQDRDRICIQKIPSAIYKVSSLPCWLLSYDKIKALVSKQYNIIVEHQNEAFTYLNGQKLFYKGFLAELKTLERE